MDKLAPMLRDRDRPSFDPRSPVQPARSPAPFLLLAVVAGIGIWTFEQYSIQDSRPDSSKSSTLPVNEVPELSPAADRRLTGVFRGEDYPPGALDRGEQGTVGVRVEVDRSGRVSRCIVTKSSGHASLDTATCRIIEARARFAPARDENGASIQGSVTQNVTWRIAE
jgi:TonB family protein